MLIGTVFTGYQNKPTRELENEMFSEHLRSQIYEMCFKSPCTTVLQVLVAQK